MIYLLQSVVLLFEIMNYLFLMFGIIYYVKYILTFILFYIDEVLIGDSGEVTPVSEASEEDFCSETLLQESDTTVVPIDTVRAKLSDICWGKTKTSSLGKFPLGGSG